MGSQLHFDTDHVHADTPCAHLNSDSDADWPIANYNLKQRQSQPITPSKEQYTHE